MTAVLWPLTGLVQGVAVEMALVYSTEDPFAVRLCTDAEDDGKDWRFARSALLKAFAFYPPEDTPAHDIWIQRTGPLGEQTEIVLMPHGHQPSSIFFATRDIHGFLRAAHAICDSDGEPSLVDWEDAETVFGLEAGQLTQAREPNHRREAS